MNGRPYTDTEIAFVREHYATMKTTDIATAIGRSLTAVFALAQKLGIRKSPDFMSTVHGAVLREAGRATRRKPGDTPSNRGLHYMPQGNEEARFKPGQQPHNTLPIGSYRISGDGYLQLKVSNRSGAPSNRWRSVHELVWIDAHGPVPAGHIVVFRSGRFTTQLEEITLDAVELVTRRELMLRNTVHRHGPEIARLSQLRGAITRQINRRQRAEDEQHR